MPSAVGKRRQVKLPAPSLDEIIRIQKQIVEQRKKGNFPVSSRCSVNSCLSLPSPDMCTSSKTKTRVSTSALFTSKSSDKLSLPDIDQLERPPRTVIAPPTLLSGLVGIDLLVSNQFNPRGQGTIHENVLGPLNRKL